MNLLRSNKKLLISLLAWLLIIAGLLLALIALLLDIILQSVNPGIGLHQLLIAGGGAGLAAFGWLLRRDHFRTRLLHRWRANLGKCSVITILTLIILELTLTKSGLGTYFENDLLPYAGTFTGKALYWLECSQESGCRYDPEMLIASCERGETTGRRCAINRDGYRDDDEFDAPPADTDQRVLLLGDSFTQGFTADLGKAFPELLDDELSKALVWNTGHTGNGTNGALAAFRAFAPRLQPQLTILGFFTGNDFQDNLYPPDSWLRVIIEDGTHIAVRRYNIDRLGNPILLDLTTTLYYHARYKPAPSNTVEEALGSTRLGALLLRTLDRFSEIVLQQRQYMLTRAYLEDLQEAVAANGSQLLTLLIPSIKDITQPTADYMAACGIDARIGDPAYR